MTALPESGFATTTVIGMRKITICALATMIVAILGVVVHVTPAMASGDLIFDSPGEGSALNDSVAVQQTPTPCGSTNANAPLSFAQNFAGTAEPSTSISLIGGFQRYLFVGAAGNAGDVSGVTWRPDTNVAASVSSGTSISIGRDTSDLGHFSSANGSAVAIAGLGFSDYFVSQVFKSSDALAGASADSSPSPVAGPSLSVQYLVPTANDVVVILVGGQNAGLLQASETPVITLVNDSYNECGTNAIASVGIFVATPGQGSFASTFSSETYLRASDASLGAVAYVLTPDPSTRPGAPRNTTVVTGNGQVTVGWAAPLSNGGAPITAYSVETYPGGRTCRSDSGSLVAMKCVVRGLLNGRTYQVTVTATNDLGTGPPSSPLDGVEPLKGRRVNLIFDSEFSGRSLPSSWSKVHAVPNSNGELQCYLPSHVSVGGGVLIEAAVHSLECGVTCPGASGLPCPYASGAVQWTSFAFTYGTVTVRAKFAGGVGAWPAVWLLGQSCQQPVWVSSQCNWPTPGSDEIDIAEVLSSNHSRINQQLHTESTDGTRVGIQCYPMVKSVDRVWHTYSLTWEPNSLIWRVDGVPTCKTSLNVPTTPMFLIIDTAVGGVGAPKVIAHTFPQLSEIDYVRVTR
jgi:hypothetical protein